MATGSFPEGEIDEDEELEWQQINEVMNVIEQQYIDAGNSVGGGVAIQASMNSRDPFNNHGAQQTQLISSVVPLPASRAGPNAVLHSQSIGAAHVSELGFAVVPQVQTTSNAVPQNIPSSSLMHVSSDRGPDVQGLGPSMNPHVPITSNAVPSNIQTSHPVPLSLIAPQTTSNRKPTETRSHPDVTRLRTLIEEQRGSLANHQNRIRGMQAELDSLRALDVEKMRSENMRLTAALSAATQESARLQEQLSYTKQELLCLRDRRRFEAVAMSHEAVGTQPLASQIAGTQIPGTQVIGSQGAGDETKNGEIRNLSIQHSSQRPPSAATPRSRPSEPRPLNNSSRNSKTPADQGTDGHQKKTQRSQAASTNASCWRLQLDDSMNNTTKAALRQHLFSGATGSSLWQLARVAGQEHLRDALLAGISNDEEWPNLLEPLTSVMNAGRGAALTSLVCTYRLLVYSDQCRRSVATLLSITMNVMEALKGAAKRADFEIADKCLHILRVMFDAVVTNGDGDQVTHYKAQVFCDVVLNWTKPMRKLPISIPQNQKALRSRVRESALSVLEVGVNVCLTSTTPPCDEELCILEEALAAASDAIRSEKEAPKCALSMLTSAACHAPSTIDDNAVAAIADACVHAIQTLRVADMQIDEQKDEVPVWEEDLVGQARERQKLASLVRGCIAVLALLTRSRNLVLRKSERNVVLGVLSVLAWPNQGKRDFHPPKELGGESFIGECRTVWMAFRKKSGV